MTQDNPAMVSPILAALFPPGVSAADLRAPADPALLLAEEARSCSGVPKRLADFTAGRLCARRALAGLGITGFALLANADRTPRWPEGIVGSITHTQGFCGAVVARRTLLGAIGLDAEIISRVGPDLWPEICRPEEVAWLRTLPAGTQARQAALLFSAKEAFYKCQYPITGNWLDFHDVAVERGQDDADTGVFAARLADKSGPWGPAGTPIPGRYRFERDLVLTGICLP